MFPATTLRPAPASRRSFRPTGGRWIVLRHRQQFLDFGLFGDTEITEGKARSFPLAESLRQHGSFLGKRLARLFKQNEMIECNQGAAFVRSGRSARRSARRSLQLLLASETERRWRTPTHSGDAGTGHTRTVGHGPAVRRSDGNVESGRAVEQQSDQTS